MYRSAPRRPLPCGADAKNMQVHAYLACAPREAGVTAALFYAVRAANVYGWLTREREGGCAAAFFAMERYYSPAHTLFCRSVDDDVYGKWIEQTAPVTTEIGSPVPEAERHELARLQSAFIGEWLFYPDDPRAHDEVEAYRNLGLPVRPVNVRSSQFHRFDQNRPAWVYASPRIDLNVVLYLKQRLPLDNHEARVLV